MTSFKELRLTYKEPALTKLSWKTGLAALQGSQPYW